MKGCKKSPTFKNIPKSKERKITKIFKEKIHKIIINIKKIF